MCFVRLSKRAHRLTLRNHIPFGYRSMWYASIFCAILMSTPSNVMLDKTRWKMSSAMSQIARRTPSFSARGEVSISNNPYD